MILELRLFLSLDWTTLSHVPASTTVSCWPLSESGRQLLSAGSAVLVFYLYLFFLQGRGTCQSNPTWSPRRGAPQHEICSAAAVTPLSDSRHLDRACTKSRPILSACATKDTPGQFSCSGRFQTIFWLQESSASKTLDSRSRQDTTDCSTT